MKLTKKFISLLIAIILASSAIICTALPVAAAEITVDSYASLSAALSGGGSGLTVKLANDITAGGDVVFESLSEPTLDLCGHTLSLGNRSLVVSNLSGIFNIRGEGGVITADNDAVVFTGSSGTLNINSNVSIVSEMSNAVVNRSSGRIVNLNGAKLFAENGCGLLLSANNSDGKSCSSALIKPDSNSGVQTEINAKHCFGVESYPTSVSGTKATVSMAQGAVLVGGEAICEAKSDYLSFVNTKNRGGSTITSGSYSENIINSYGVSIRNGYSLLRDGEFYGVYSNSSIGSVSDEESYRQALDIGGAYYVTDDFAVSESGEITSDANIIIDGQGHTIEFINSGSYIVGDISDGIRVTMSNLIFDGKNKADSLYTKVVTDLLSKPNTIYLFDCSDSSFKDKVLAFRYKLETDSALSSPYTINTGEKISLDLNGHTVSTLGDFAAFNVDGELLITDSDGNGKILSEEPFDTSDGGSVSIYGGTYNSSVYNYIAEDLAGFIIKNDDGTSTVYSGSDVLKSATAKESSDVMRYGNLHNLETLGYQKKATGKLKGNGVDTQGIRLVTVVNSGLIKSANIKDYGYVIAKYDGDKEIGELNFSGLRPWSYNGEKVISCRNSTNNFANEYGLYSAETKYKYVTLAVNGMKDGDRIVARFYIRTTDGKLYFSNYSNYNGILAEY